MTVRILRVDGSDRNTDLYEISGINGPVSLMVRVPAGRELPQSELLYIKQATGDMTFLDGTNVRAYMDSNLTYEQIAERIVNLGLVPNKSEVLITVRSSSVRLSDGRVIQMDTDIVDDKAMKLCPLNVLCNHTISEALTIGQLRVVLEDLCRIWDDAPIVPMDGWFYETLTETYTAVKDAPGDLAEDLMNFDPPDDFIRESETGNVTILMSRNDVAQTWASYLNLIIETCGPLLHKD